MHYVVTVRDNERFILHVMVKESIDMKYKISSNINNILNEMWAA